MKQPTSKASRPGKGSDGTHRGRHTAPPALGPSKPTHHPSGPRTTSGTDSPPTNERTDRESVVEAIHTQLECLKYVGTIRENTPTGEGTPVSILLMPDLVFDFRAYNLRAQPARKVCAVGGRAARIACALLHLQDEDDATYHVHLLTETGNLGRLLLENEFTEAKSNRPSSRPPGASIGNIPRCTCCCHAAMLPPGGGWDWRQIGISLRRFSVEIAPEHQGAAG
jgi:hypothetical protein